ncbi:MAG: glycosyl hydrolase family 18 protein [Candidatus Dojkabacteria bacterium]|nr:MAG: glycosyl hydrolase family 18 protein [Candidatus Dojkabacteria bacterium]
MNYTLKKRTGIIFLIIILSILAGLAIIIAKISRTEEPERTSKNQQEQVIDIEREEIVKNLRAEYNDALEDQFSPLLENFEIDSYSSSVTFEEIARSSSSHKIKELGWIPSWAYASGVESVRAKGDQLSHVSPVWYAIDANGNIVSRVSNRDQLVQLAEQEDFLLIPTITCFDFNDFHTSTADEAKLQQHIDTIVSIVLDNGYDGIDLDYESIQEIDGEAFMTIVEEVGERLHEEDKLFSVTVLSKWGDNVIYPAFQETRRVQQWDDIARHVDQLRIMTYDYTSPSGEIPGPIAPTDWMIAVMEYAVTKVPREKLWMGVHLYSYEWQSSGDNKSYFRETVKSVLDSEDAEPYYDMQTNEAIAAYNCRDTEIECILYYPTRESIEARKKIAQYFKIAGVAYWSLGKDGDLISE